MRMRLHPVPLLAGLAVVLATVQLGNWQVGRALEKAALQAKFDSAAASRSVPLGLAPPEEWQSVELRGSWHPGHGIFIDNRVHERRVGYHVVMPFELSAGRGWVLVNRGWVAGSADRSRVPEVAAPSGEVTIAGRVRRPAEKPFTLADEPARGKVWQVLDVELYRSRTGLPVADYVVQQTGGSEDGLVREWPRPDAGVDRHRGYALQWYALAVLAGGLTGWYVLNGLRRNRRDVDKPGPGGE